MQAIFIKIVIFISESLGSNHNQKEGDATA